MNVIWSITRKDLLSLSRDRRALAVLIAMPMVFIAILGFSTGKMIGWQNENTRLTLVVTDLSQTSQSAALIERLDETEGIKLTEAADRESARRAVDQGSHAAAIVIGEAFTDRVASASLADILEPEQGMLSGGLEGFAIDLYAQTGQPVAASLARQLVWSSLIRELTSDLVNRDPLVRAYLSQQQDNDVSPTTQPQPPAAGRFVTADYRAMAYQIIVPAYAVLFAYFLVNIMSRSILAERNQGTLARLHVAPVSSTSVVFGKTLPFLMISILQGIALLAFGKILFGLSWGAYPLMVIVVIVCTSLAATALSLFVAVLVRSDAQVSAYGNLLVISLGGLSGCFMPREWLPPLMKKLSLAIPHAWSLIAYDQLLTVPLPDLALVWQCCGVLIGFSIVLLAAGVAGFHLTCRTSSS